MVGVGEPGALLGERQRGLLPDVGSLRPVYAGQGFVDRTFLKLLYREVTMPLLAG